MRNAAATLAVAASSRVCLVMMVLCHQDEAAYGMQGSNQRILRSMQWPAQILGLQA